MTQNRSNLLIGLLAATVVVTAGSAAHAGRKSSKKERQRAVDLAQQLEQNPLDARSAKVRTDLLAWWTKVPDIELEMCAAFLLEVGEENKELGGIVVLQNIFSAGAFVIENEERAQDRRAVWEAGLRGALRAYSAVLTEDPRMRSAFLDKLSSDEQAFVNYLDRAMNQCE